MLLFFSSKGQFKCVRVFFINIVINSFSKFSKDVNSILIFVGWNNSLWTPCQELVLLYDMIEWLMNILHSMPGVLSTLHSMPGVYLNEICTPMPGVYLNFALHARHIQKSWVVCSFTYPRWRFLQARNFYKDFLKKYFVRGCGHFSEVKYMTFHR